MLRAGVVTQAILLLALGVVPGGCSEAKDAVGKDAAVSDLGADGPSWDAGPDQQAAAPDAGPGNMGQGCTTSSECTGAADRCLTMSSSKQAAICSRYCTLDKTETPLENEDDCPTGFQCATITMNDGSTKNYCFEKCTPSFSQNPCPASSKLTCHPSSTRYAKPGQAICFYTACTENKDCPVYSATTCAIDVECSGVAADAFCDNGLCARPGNCTNGGICGVHTGLGTKTAAVGDPCDSDLDCPENGACIEESSTYDGSIGVAFHNGYCVVRYCSWPKDLSEFTCPTGSTCNILYYGGYCFRSCNPAKAEHCRGYAGDQGGDYECYDWTTWSLKGVKIAKEPMCLNASAETCDSLGNSTCDSLGPKPNATNMSCRDRYTGQPRTNPKDPLGVCLDDTASGSFLSAAPDGGYPDAGVPDATPGGD